VMMAKVRVDEHYRITIPKDIRERMNIKTGDELVMYEEHGLIILRKPTGKELLRLAGCWHGYPEDPEKFVNELRRVWSSWRP